MAFRRDAVTWLAYGMLGFFNYLLSGLGPLMPFLRQELDLSYTEASLHFSAFALGMILAGVFGDRVVARYGRWRTFWSGAAGLSLGAIALTLARHPVLTIGSVLLMGSIGSLALVLIPAILADRHGPNRALAIVEANILSAATGAMAGIVLGAGERSALGWRGAFLTALIVPLGLALCYGRVPLPTPSRLSASDQQRGARLPAAFWAYWVTIILAVGVEFSLIFWGADFLVASGLSAAAAATTVSLFLWGMVVGRIAGRQIAQRIATERLLPVSLAVSAIGFFIYWLAPFAVLAVVGLFIAGFGVANLFPITSALALGAAPGLSTEAGARLSLASGIAILTAPLLLGSLANAVGIWLAYAIVPVLLLGAFVGSWTGRRLGGRSRPAR